MDATIEGVAGVLCAGVPGAGGVDAVFAISLSAAGKYGYICVCMYVFMYVCVYMCIIYIMHFYSQYPTIAITIITLTSH